MSFPADVLNNRTALDEILKPIYQADPWYNIGPTVLPWPIDSFLYGVLLYQAMTYFTSDLGRADSRWMQGTVVGCVVLGTVTTIMSWRWSCTAILTHNGEYWPYTASEFGGIIYPVMGTGVLLFNGFYCHRAWLLYNKHWAVPAVVMTLSVATFVGSVGITSEFLKFFIEQEGDTLSVKLFAYLYLYPAAVADLTLTVLLVNALLRRRSGWKGTDKILKKLVLLCFETQIPPTVFALSLAIQFTCKFALYLAYPYVQLSGKIYACSLIRTLNSREEMREMMQGSENVNDSFRVTGGGSGSGGKNTGGAIAGVLSGGVHQRNMSGELETDLYPMSPMAFSNRSKSPLTTSSPFIDPEPYLYEERKEEPEVEVNFDREGSKVHLVVEQV